MNLSDNSVILCDFAMVLLFMTVGEGFLSRETWFTNCEDT